MNKFLKSGLGLVAMAGLASGSLFAFNISTTIDNALQVIKTIWVTSDGTTNNPPFITMDGSGGYVSIGTTASGETLNLSGTAYIQNGNRGWEYLAEQQYPGVQNLGGRYTNGIQSWQQGIVSTSQILAYTRWINNINNNEILNFVDNDETALSYCDDRQECSSIQQNTFHNYLGLSSNGIEASYDRWNTTSNRNTLNINNAGLSYQSDSGSVVVFDRSGHVGINVSTPLQALSVSGTFEMAYNDSYGYNALLGYDDPFFNGSLGFLYGGNTGSTMVGIFPSGGDKIGVMIHNDGPNAASSVAVESGSSSITRSFDASGTVNQITVDDDGVIVTTSGNQNFWFTKDRKFGARTSNPGNTIDIFQTAIPGTLGLRLASGPGNSGQILGVNDDGDVIMLGNIGGFGGGGPNYWTQNGNDMYPTTLANNIGIGTNTPSETLSVSGSFLSEMTNAYGVTAHLTLDNMGNLLGLPFVGAQASSGSSMVIVGIDTANQSAGLINQNGLTSSTTILQATKTFVQSAYCRTLGCNNVADRNGLEADSSGTIIRGYNIGSGTYNTKWQNASDSELMRITNNGNVGIGTNDPTSLLNVSGSFLAQHHQAAISLSTGFYSGINFYPIPTASLTILDPSATGLTTATGISSQVSVYDTRAINPSDPTVGATMATFSPDPFNQNQRAAVSVQNASEIALDVHSGAIHTSLDVESDRLEIYSSGGASSMYFDGIIGLFGFGTTTPDNTIDIGGAYINGTAGLRLSPFAGNSGQILGVNNDGDVVMLGNIGGFGGGGPQYWAQSGNSIYPTTLTNNVGIGINNPSTRLGIAGSILATSGSSRGWEFANDTLVNGLNRIGGWFTSGTQYVQNTITDLYNGLPIANMGWFDTNTNEESNFSAFQQSVTMHYNSDRTSTNSGLRNGIDITPNDVEIKYDQNNISGNYIELNLGPLGFGVNGFGFTHMFTNSGYVGINNISPSHTLTVSGTFLANDGGQGLAVGPNLLGMGIPGAMNTYTTGTQLGFMFAGNPGANPIFDAGAGAYLGFIDMIGFNDRAILSVKSGSIEFGIDQGGIDEAEFDFNTEYWSVESNSGFDNLWMDFNTNRIGINHASPQKALDVSGAIVSSAMFIGGASSFSGTIDVQNVNSIFVDPSGGDIDIHGLTNGTVGQVIYIIRNQNGANNVTIYNNSNGNNADFRNPGSLNLSIGTNRGLQFIYNGWNWMQIQ